MLNVIRVFGKTIWAKILLSIIIIPFIFWGMGDVFRGGSTNTIVKINKHRISTQNFIDHINLLNLNLEVIRDNIDNSIIEDILYNLINETLLTLEAKKLNIELSDSSLSEIIKKDQNFIGENNQFSRTKYEKFLITNNITAVSYEKKLKIKETNRRLFSYISGGIYSPSFLVKKTFYHQNKKLSVQALNLDPIYAKEQNFNDLDIQKYIDENKDRLKEYFISFRFSSINPRMLIDSEEFNELFFEKIDEIENLIINDTSYETIIKKYNLNFNTVKLLNKDRINESGIFQESINQKLIDKIIELKIEKINTINLIEYENEYVLIVVDEIKNSIPSINSKKFKEKIIKELTSRNIFKYNQKLITKIKTNSFDKSDLIKLANRNQIKIKNVIIDGIKDESFFNVDTNQKIFELPLNGFALVTSGKDNITFLIRIEDMKKPTINKDSDEFEKYKFETIFNLQNDIYVSFDHYLNQKYKIEINDKTLKRLKNYYR